MKYIKLTKNIPTLDFQESKIPIKDINTVKKFKSLVLDNGDDGIREISKILKEKSLKNFKVTNSEFKKADKLLDDDIKNAILVAYSNIKKYHEKQLEGLSIKTLKQQKELNYGLSLDPLML